MTYRESKPPGTPDIDFGRVASLDPVVEMTIESRRGLVPGKRHATPGNSNAALGCGRVFGVTAM